MKYGNGGEIGNIKYTISKGKDSEERIVSFEEGDFGSYKVEKHEAKFLKGWNRNGGNGWSYEKNVSRTYPTIRLAILNYLQNKRSNKYENGGVADVRMEDTVQRMDDPHFADISYYGSGGKIDYTQYYKQGGESTNSCEKLDSKGERKIDLGSIEDLTECVNSLPQTKEFHYHDGDYDPERKDLHKKIIYKIKKDLICVENKNPIAILMGGSPASGKSTFLKKYRPYLLKEEILKIDADEIRSQLPEYKGYNATQTHLETKDIVNLLLSDRNIGIPCRFDLIYDGTMNNTKSYMPLIQLLKSLGYKIFVVYIDKVPKDVIVNRALERYKRSGRFVPLEVIDDFFTKGKTALNEIKKEVDGYMIVDGSDSNYEVIEKGGMQLPKNRSYSKIGSPIKVTTEDVVREYKEGGEIQPDNPKLKDKVVHSSGKVGGMLVGKRHSEGGIKAINKSTGQPLEMEGGEVVITRNAVSDNTKREFEGKMMTNKQILSKINESGGGVSFAKGGKVKSDEDCGCDHYDEGGDIKAMKSKYPKDFEKGYREEMREHKTTFGNLKRGKISLKKAAEYVVAKHLSEKPNYYKNYKGGGFIELGDITIPSLDKFLELGVAINSPFQEEGHKYVKINDSQSKEHQYYTNGDKKSNAISNLLAYETYLYDTFGVLFSNLAPQVKNALTLGNQALLDNYFNSLR
jgi:predicted ABC-type ATPase